MIGMSVMFHNIFNSLARFRYLSSFSSSFTISLWSAGTVKSTKWHVLFFLLIKTKPDLLAWIEWYICISKSKKIYFLRQILVCAYTVCQLGKTSVSCTISNRSPSLLSHTCSCIVFFMEMHSNYQSMTVRKMIRNDKKKTNFQCDLNLSSLWNRKPG